VRDIEDLQKACRRRCACPYFTARELANTAELVFCPYNYIIDPCIRAATNISLSGSILVFDEAHNIEDVAREAASCDIKITDLQQAEIDAAGPATSGEQHAGLFQPLYAGLKRLISWLARTAGDRTLCRTLAMETFEGVWSGGQVRCVTRALAWLILQQRSVNVPLAADEASIALLFARQVPHMN
jgi:fanconi anemia group J protein